MLGKSKTFKPSQLTDEDSRLILLAIGKCLWELYPQAIECHLPDADKARLRAILMGQVPVVEHR